MNKKKKDSIKKYYKIIWGLKTITDVQLQLQNIIKLVDAANNQLADIKTTLLQIGEIHKIQIGRNIYSISEELWNIICEEMECQAHYIQVLLADKLDYYKEKCGEAVD